MFINYLSCMSLCIAYGDLNHFRFLSIFYLDRVMHAFIKLSSEWGNDMILTVLFMLTNVLMIYLSTI
jgi:hypothetical protein